MSLRREFESRPLAPILGGAVLGCAIAVHPFNACFLLTLFAPWKRQTRVTLLVCTALWFGLSMLVRPAIVSAPKEFVGEVDVVGQPRPSSFGTSCLVRSGDIRFMLFFDRAVNISLGDQWYLKGTLEPVSEVMDRYAAGRGISGRMRHPSIAVMRRSGSILWRAGARMRMSFASFSDNSLSPRASAVLRAVCFSDETDVPDEWMRSLRRSGTIHIISTSGLHVILLAGALTLALSGLPVARAIQLVLLAVLLLAYAAASGLQPPAVRAVIMSLVMAIAYLCSKEPDGLSALSVAALLYLTIQPWCIQDIGTQLSFLVVGALVMFVHPPRGHVTTTWQWVRNWSVATVKAGIVASVASAPLVAYHFGMLSLTSIAANLLIAPVVVMVIVPALCAWMMSPLLPAIAVGLQQVVVSPLVGWTIWVVDILGSGRWTALEVFEFNSYWLPAVYAALLLLWRPYVRTP